MAEKPPATACKVLDEILAAVLLFSLLYSGGGMYRARFMVSVLGLLLFASAAYAGTILPSATGTAASNAGWPAPPASATHSHGTFVNAGEMGVEEERGIVEFN